MADEDFDLPDAEASEQTEGRLENTFDWAKHCAIAGALGVIIVGLLANQRTNGWVEAAVVIAVLVAGYCLWAWRRAQQWIEPRGDTLRVGRGPAYVDIAGADVDQVRYVMNRHSPDFTLIVKDGRKHTIRTSHLRTGHSTLFRWLRASAPQATFDKGTLRIEKMLESRGLLP